MHGDRDGGGNVVDWRAGVVGHGSCATSVGIAGLGEVEAWARRGLGHGPAPGESPSATWAGQARFPGIQDLRLKHRFRQF